MARRVGVKPLCGCVVVNAQTCLSIIFDLHKNFTSELESEVPGFIQYFINMYRQLQTTVSHVFSSVVERVRTSTSCHIMVCSGSGCGCVDWSSCRLAKRRNGSRRMQEGRTTRRRSLQR